MLAMNAYGGTRARTPIGLLLACALTPLGLAEIVSYRFTGGFVNQDTGGIYAPGTPVSGAIAYVTGAPPTQQLSNGRTIYTSSPAHPFYVALMIGPDTYEYLDVSQGRMMVQNFTGDRFEFSGFSPVNLTSRIEFEFTDFQGTVFSSQAMPTIIDFVQFDQPLDFMLTRPSAQGPLIFAWGVINPFTFSSAPPPPGMECAGDLNGDRVVNLTDLAILLAHFGTQDGATRGEGDLNGDHDVDLSDLASLLSVFGSMCT